MIANRRIHAAAVVLSLMLWSSIAGAQTIVELGLSVERTLLNIPSPGPTGMDIDPDTGDVYFLAVNGARLSALRTNDAIETVAQNIGPFGGTEADLRIGPDGFIHLMGLGELGLTPLERFSLDGERQEIVYRVIAEPYSGFGLAFDCQGQLFLSDNSSELYRIGNDGFLGIFSEGWNDIDEIERGPDNTLFVHHNERDRVYLVQPDGSRSVYVQGLSNITTGTYDWAQGNYLVADTQAGIIYRLRDANQDNVIANPGEITVVARDLGQIGDIVWGRSSNGPQVFSLYVGNPSLGRIIEITGFAAPPGGRINCGNLFDDDGDRWCEFGFDENGDGDCEDPFEEQPRGDCNDADPAVNPDATELCDEIDNDCNFDTADGLGDPLFGRPCDGDDADLCLEGQFFCARGLGMRCDDTTGDIADLCDGFDNDCNPDTPDGADSPGFGQACDGNDADLCEEGVLGCQEGAIRCTDDTDDTLDVCDGQDNDCNPQTLDGSGDPRLDVPCDGDDQDLCAEGVFSCQNGVPSCSDDDQSIPDLCDGQDNDCNPDTPDGADELEFGQPCDGPDQDRCLEGQLICAGAEMVCDDATDSSVDVCNGIDDDCDPLTPDGFGEAGFGLPCDGNDNDACEDGVLSCNGNSLVCSDDELSVVEICNDTLDNDCDGNADDLDFDCRGSLDLDEDGFCPDGEDLNDDGDCTDPGEDEGRRDCNDVSSNINPDAVEICDDNQDNDCDDAQDLDDVDCERVLDLDNDGFCGEGTDNNDDGDCLDEGEQEEGSDCDEESPRVNSAAVELCDDEIDNDCDGAVDAQDPDCPQFADRDGDGFCPAGRDNNADGDCLDEGEDTEDSDCDDTVPETNSAAMEVCGDEVDNDCDGGADVDDEDCALLVDDDQDGFCEDGQDGNSDGDCFDEGERLAPGQPGDCNDEDPAIAPDADEICADEEDNDCDETIDAEDEDCRQGVDGDGDGICPLGQDSNGDGDCLDAGEDTDVRDCDDTAPEIFEGNPEVCGDELDNDCDEAVDAEDEDCFDFADRDTDDFCPQGRDLNRDGDCLDEGEDNGDVDCNDDEIFIHPEANERCDDEIDNDCDGLTDLEDTEDCQAPAEDTDEDGVPDDEDNCPAVANPDQSDSDNNSIGDACDSPADDSCGCTSVDHRRELPGGPWPILLLSLGAMLVVRRRR